LSEQTSIDEFQNKGLTTIRRNSEYLADLIEGLLNISKIEAGRLELHRNRICLPDLLDQLELIFSPEASAKRIDFTLNRSANLPKYVTADEKRLRQILINLISNAVKYTNEGSVTVDVRYRNQVADISVRDTGVGISQENIERIMRPFERVRTANVPDVTGTGLGLTIVRLLTEIMGGELKVESELGKGSEFRVSILLFETDMPDAKRSIVEGIDAYQGERKTVLVVDDEAIHRGLVSDLLQPLGFRIFEAPDAETARTMLSSSIDLFLLDISMPGENGMSLAAYIRSEYPQVPIIMLSADAEEQHLKAIGEDKIYNAYIIKPMNNQTLLMEITQHLDLTWSYRDENIHDSQLVTETTELADTEAVDEQNIDSSNVLDLDAPPLTLIPVLRELEAHLKIGHSKGVRNVLPLLEQASWPGAEVVSNWQILANNYHFQEVLKQIEGFLDSE